LHFEIRARIDDAQRVVARIGGDQAPTKKRSAMTNQKFVWSSSSGLDAA